jgi:alanyl-tRNA synthetase
LKTDSIREAYLDFFKGKAHRIVPSSSLVPYNDPTLLFTGAGMNQFKSEFLGFVKDFTRAASCQKCLRTTDIENVGRTPRHHTFFEMLGNFSFGDYFKEQAIEWGWEFLTKTLNIKPELLWVSIYINDDESYSIWNKNIAVPSFKIVRLGDKENFWPSNAIKDGPDGPCGPCSEIYFDQGPERGCSSPICGIQCSCGRYVEIWNLVFTQYNRKSGGILENLPNKNIDTGMGLERIAAVMQKVPSNYEIDIIKPIVDFVKECSKNNSEQPCVALKVIADHIRAVSFAICDGIIPSNEERGYCLRMLIRRAMRFGSQIGIKKPFLYKIVPILAEAMKGAYPEILQKRENISCIILSEENRFLKTLEEGTLKLNSLMDEAIKKGEKVLSGGAVFKLYDTYGFPVDLTKTIAQEKNLEIDLNGFNNFMDNQKKTSRGASNLPSTVFVATKLEDKIRQKQIISDFVGYQNLLVNARVVGILKSDEWVETATCDDEVDIILDKTPFYPQSGGQAGDTGFLKTSISHLQVIDTQKIQDAIIHKCKVLGGLISVGEAIIASVDAERRLQIARSHTSTHILQSVLRNVLGHHIEQSGSYVGPDRLRFDFTHFRSIEDEDLKEIEKLVNHFIIQNLPVGARITKFEEAKNLGALALFTEKYKEDVRLVNIGNESRELCGGTHLEFTGQVGVFIILSEESIASGIRRIEAITGEAAYNYIKGKMSLVDKICKQMNTQQDRVLPSIEKIIVRVRELEKENAILKTRNLTENVSNILQGAFKIKDTVVLIKTMNNADDRSLRSVLDRIKEKVRNVVVVLFSIKDDRVIIVSGVSDGLISKISAGKIANEVAKKLGGSGGGNPKIGQAGGKDKERLNEAMEFAKYYVQQNLEKE